MSLMAVPGLNSEMAGIIVYWRLSGPISTYTFRNAWLASNLPETGLPAEPSVEVAAGRAAKSLRGSGNMVRRYKAADDSNHWTVAAEVGETETTITHNVECRVLVEASGIRVVPFDHHYAQDIRNAFDTALGEWSSNDISVWLVRLIEQHDAISLRDTGGFYFIPPYQVARWRQAAKVVNENTGHRLYEIPAVRSEEAVAAVSDAIQAEAEAFANKLEEELAADLGVRALGNRRAASDAMLRKLGRYEELLGTRLTALRERVEAVQAQVAAGELAAMETMVLPGLEVQP